MLQILQIGRVVMGTARLGLVGDRQVVYLPDGFDFGGSEVHIYRDATTGDVLLSPKPNSWKNFFAMANRREVSADFMANRKQPDLDRDPCLNSLKEDVTSSELDRPAQEIPQVDSAFQSGDAFTAFERCARTSEFDEFRQAVIEGRLDLDDAVRVIIKAMLSRRASE